jgi:hypothetical protein
VAPKEQVGEPADPAYHVEVRQFPNVARSFNLTRRQLDAQIIVPWQAGRVVLMDDRKFSPDRAKLKIVEGPALRTDEIAIGRGWANAERAGEDATQRLLAETGAPATPTGFDPSLEEFKESVIDACTDRRLELGGVVVLAARRYPRSRASECLALAERAVWELLHQHRVGLCGPDGDPVPRERWEAVVLAWESWTTGGPAGPAGPALQASSVIPPLGASPSAP